MDAEYFRDHGHHVPAGRTGEVVVHAPAFVVEIFWDTGIDTAGFKVQCFLCQGFQCLPAFLGEAALIEGVGIHDGHVGEYCAVFLLAVGKAKHAAHVEFQFLEIGIQPVAANLFFVKVLVRTFTDTHNLLVRSGTAHDGEHLSGEHHAHAAVKDAFDPLLAVVVVAVKPAFLQPLLTAKMLHQPVSHGFQLFRKGLHRNRDGFAADVVMAAAKIVCQGCQLTGNAVITAIQKDLNLFQQLYVANF